MNNRFSFHSKVSISKTSDKPSFVRESFVDFVSDVVFESLITSLLLHFGYPAVVTFVISPILDLFVR